MTMSSNLSTKMRSLALMPVLGLAACATTTGSYTAPTPPKALPSVAAAQLPTGTPSAVWWTQFNDERLDELVALAWAANHDLKAAAERLAAAREGVAAAGAARWPTIGIGSTNYYQREGGHGQWDTQVRGTVDMEVDLFGRIDRAVEAARADEGERAQLLEDTRRLVLARVVEAYLELRSAQQLRQVIVEQLANQDSTLQLVKERVAAGSAAPAERVRFEAQVRLTEARLPALAAQERSARNRLATLTGSALDAAAIVRLHEAKSLAVPDALVTDEPAQLLRRRPDVAAAERALAASMARESLARMQFLPRISLSALLGGPRSLVQLLYVDTVVDGGARSANARASSAQIKAAVANYEKAIAVALEEADTAVSNWTHTRERLAKLESAHQLAQESAGLARIRYREGAESLLGVLEAERTALGAREELVTAQRDLVMATSRAYVAVAGGFDQPSRQLARTSGG
jgi:NodT family efflux transporter outer membrane factor (OMF) lipoprotein